jgi:hypothetical protein
MTDRPLTDAEKLRLAAEVIKRTEAPTPPPTAITKADATAAITDLTARATRATLDDRQRLLVAELVTRLQRAAGLCGIAIPPHFHRR